MNYRKLSIVAFVSFIFIAAKSDLPTEFTFKNFEKTLAFVSNNLYASKYETTNLQYTTFLKELKKEGKIQEYALADIDSMNWKTEQAFNDPYIEFYHRHEAYKNYPVINISYEGAVMFCEWMTKKYNEYPKRKFKKVKFRLPKETEWVKAARGGLNGTLYPWGGYFITNAKGCAMCNCARGGDENITYNKETGQYELRKQGSGKKLKKAVLSEPPSIVNAFYPNDFGIYNMSGNVAEMMQEKGKLKGGSMCSGGYDVRIDAVDTFEKPDIDIGFRYFVEIIEN